MGHVMSILDEGISGIRIVKAYNMEGYEKDRFSAENRRYYRNWMKRIAVRALSSPLMELIAGLAAAFILWYGGMQVVEGSLSAGDFASFILAMGMLYAPIRKLNTVNIEIQEGIAAAKRIFNVLDTVPEIGDKPGAEDLGRVDGEFAFHDVSFTYTGEEYALTNVSFTARRGQRIALVGESGSGKTTIANLLPRLFEVTSGRIVVGGRDIRDVTMKSLRRNIAMVTQDMVLFNDTIRPTSPTEPRTPPRRASRMRPAPPMRTISSCSCPKGTTPWSARAAFAFRAGSVSGSASHGPSSRTPPSSSWTRRPRRSTPNQSARCRRRWRGS